ncbi:MAG TPA: NAD(P)/FAD-dependent oxidoreductase [Acidimicrobiia bacterium]|nr:NAD(P)/FAD-dependent oxidoreductase [Acidimicrobiia bacterium]
MAEPDATARGESDVVVVGAGFAGLHLLHSLRNAGFSVRVLEAGGGVGGTWYWNRYPGARCDVQSLEYSFGFDPDLEQEWDWTEKYATQDEILRYLDHVADRYDLRRDIHFDTRVTRAAFADTTNQWTVETERGERFTCRFLVAATGCLSSANLPDIPGRDSFAGPTYHTGRWPHDGVDFTGLRVGVIGTGSSAVQSIPIIAEQAADLTVFQRTATYSVPAYNAPLSPEHRAGVKARYRDVRAINRTTFTGYGALSALPEQTRPFAELDDDERQQRLEEAWRVGGLTFLGAFMETIISPEVNEYVAEFVRAKIRAIVRDPEVAELLCPRQPIGCKRLCVDTGYYETFNRPNVHLVDISAHGIEAITSTGIRANGADHELDAIVFATGFDAMTGALLKIGIEGADGRTLADAWKEGPKTYLGLAVHGFPNLFLVTGPGSPSVLTNMVTSIEQHTEWITECLTSLRAGGHERIEADAQAVEEWVAYVNTVADFTLLPNCNSWYLGANIPGKPRVFMPLPGFPPYADRCAEVAARGYEGFVIDGA